jgi:putative nucleotidyltransferase with HDIG domain
MADSIEVIPGRDEDELFAPGVEPCDDLRQLIMTTRDLPAMPHVASKVLELSSDPNTSALKLQQVISDDQAMAARILKIANSAMYACSRKIKTLTEAIVMLGFNSIRSLVVTSAARNLYTSNGVRMGLKERLLWEHSIGVACASRLLVQNDSPHLAEEAFLAGLMHDIGKLVLNQQAAERFDEIVQTVYNENSRFAQTERALLGFDHAEVGALLVNKWKLSPMLELIIATHHRPETFTADNPLLLYLDLANEICHQQGVGFVHDESVVLHECASNRILGLGEEYLAGVVDKLKRTLETEMEIFV